MSTPTHDALPHARREWVAHGWPNPDVMAGLTEIMQVSRLVSGAVDAVLRPFEISYARFETLAILYFTPGGVLPLGKLSEQLQVHPATVTSIVDRLERQGTVRRVRRDGDRRIVFAEILPAGRELTEQAIAAVAREMLPRVALSGEEIDVLHGLLDKVRRSIGDGG